MTATSSALLNGWELYADLGSALVWIGVTGEGLELILKFIKRKYKRAAEWCQSHEIVLDFWESIFWIMVVLGLWMEWRGNHKSGAIKADIIISLTTNLDATIAKAGELEKEAVELTKTNLSLAIQLAVANSNIVRMDPLNMSVWKLSASVRVYVRGSADLSRFRQSQLFFSRTPTGPLGPISTVRLEGRGFSIGSDKIPFWEANFIDQGNGLQPITDSMGESVNSLLHNLNCASIALVPQPDRPVDILYGWIVLEVNGFPVKRYWVPAQIATRSVLTCLDRSSQ